MLPDLARSWHSACNLGERDSTAEKRRSPMQVELLCPHCEHRFRVPPDAPVQEALDRVADEGPWSALGDGETFEDKLYTALNSGETIHCPACAAAVPVSEEDLAKLAL